MKLRRAVIALSILGLGLGLGSAQAQQQKLLMNTFIGVNHPITTQILRPWANDISKATEGRVIIDIAPTSLSAPPQQLDGVVKGVFDVAYQFHGFLAPKVKLTNVAQLPFVNSTAKGSSVALWRTYEKFFAAANELPDVQVLGFFVGAPGPIFPMKNPVNTLGDLKGTKMYALPGVPARLFEAAGAGVVAAPAVRSHEIISGGTVDSFAGYSLMDADAFKTLQYAKEVIDLPGHLTVPAFAFFMNKKKWSAISAKDREAIMKLSGESFAQRFVVYDNADQRVRAESKAKGLVFKTASPQMVAELRKLAEPLEAAWLADAASLGVDGKAALAFFKEEAIKNQ